MKKLVALLMMMFIAVAVVQGQRLVSGMVVDDYGEGLVGANVLVKGSSLGTVTDANGRFNLEVPTGSGVLRVSYAGFITEEIDIENQTNIDVQLTSGILLTEAIITALGIEREEKSLGYAVQELQGDDLSVTREQNLVTALSGKVAGVQVVSASGASLGGTAKIRIRGANSLTGGDPLFVVDGTPVSNANFSADESGHDFGNLAQDVNPEDIESVTVLKGPAATALYGHRASGGVILVVTKKGQAREGIGVQVKSTVTLDRVSILPEYQNTYAGGSEQKFVQWNDPVDGQSYQGLDYAADWSWGPRIDGTMYRPWWSWYPGTPEYGIQIPLTAHPDNVRDFFDTGVTYDNSVALSGGNEHTSFRLSYRNVHADGVIPNSKLIRNNVLINAQTNLTPKLLLRASVNLATNTGHARPEYGYSGNNPVQSLNQWFQRQLDMDRLRDYKLPDGTFKSWNINSAGNLTPAIWDNPYVMVYENFGEDSRDRYFGNISLAYELNDYISVQGFVRRDSYNQRIEDRTASGTMEQDRYSNFIASGVESNYEILLSYEQRFGDFSLDANAGGNIRNNNFRSESMETVGGLSVPNLYNISASIERPNVSNYLSEKVVRSLYAQTSFGYKSLLYLGATVRNDWSSALPADGNSYLYPSVSLSLVFSELLDSPFLSFGKVRGSFAQVGSDTDPYQTTFVYDPATPYENNTSFTLPNTLVNKTLKPSLTSSYEIGLDVRFFNRIGLDVTYYHQDAEDQILAVQVPGSSGVQLAIINAGKITSRGVEVMLTARPFRSANFSWDLNFNIAHNTSRVEELADGLDNRLLDVWSNWSPFLSARVGEEWGIFDGTGFTELNGQRVITPNGFFVITSNKPLGNILPDATGGLRNTLEYKNLTLGAFLDFQLGGLFHSTTLQFHAFSGLSPVTTALNDKGNPQRNPVSEGGGVRVDGVLEDGTPHTVYVDAQQYWTGLFNIQENWMYDATFVKLRELSLSYKLPQTLFGGLPFSSARISVFGRNLWLIHANVDGIDPSELSPGRSQYIYQESGILPAVRTLGISANIGL